MTDPTGVAKEGVKVLGPGAYLVTAFPSMVLVLTIFALLSSRLYPFAETIENKGKTIAPGVPSVLHTARSLGIAGGIVLAVAVLAAAVLLRPLQISLVQVLEGYWGSRGRYGFVEALAVERHQRRRARSLARVNIVQKDPRQQAFGDVAAYARVQRHLDRLSQRALTSLASYPLQSDHVMPTRLGNVLRRAETVAGERYGLSTVDVYPRIYPHLSPRLEGEIANQLDSLDSTATFTVLFALQAILAAPLLGRIDWWSMTPLVFAILATVAYLGAVKAAGRHGSLLEVAFDLHRFDMLAAMRLNLPGDPAQEREENERLSAFLNSSRTPYRAHLVAPDEWTYHHPATDPDLPKGVWATAPEEKAGADAGKSTGSSDEGAEAPAEDATPTC